MEKGQDPRYFQSLYQMEGGGVLAGIQSIDLPQSLKGLFADSYVEQLAKESGFVKRKRKIAPVIFFWTMILGFGKAKSRTVASFRHCYESISGRTLVPSAFYDRFTPALVVMLKAAIAHALDSFRLSWSDSLVGPFRDVVLVDATVVKLLDGLKNVFRGSRTNSAPAAVKLHAVMSVKGTGRSTVGVTSGRVHEIRKLSIGPWVRGKLLVFDLGFYRFQLFSCIQRNGGFFLTRLKEKANPVITTVFRRVRGKSIALDGRRLQDVIASLKREVLDVEAELVFQRRVYGGKRRTARERFRIVAIRDERTRKYHTYITNIPPRLLDAEDIASCYRGRWVIELIFKELKSGYRLDQVSSARKPVAEAFLYAAILTLLVSRRLFCLLARDDEGQRFRTGRWWTLFAAHAGTILIAMLDRRRCASLLDNLLVTFKHELMDPHRNRTPLLVDSFGKYKQRRFTLIGSACWVKA